MVVNDEKLELLLTQLRANDNLKRSFQNAHYIDVKLNQDKLIIDVSLENPFDFKQYQLLIKTIEEAKEDIKIDKFIFECENDYSIIALDKLINDLASSLNYDIDKIPHYNIENDKIIFINKSKFETKINFNLIHSLNNILQMFSSSYSIENTIVEDKSIEVEKNKREAEIKNKITKDFEKRKEEQKIIEANDGYYPSSVDECGNYNKVEIRGQIIELEGKITKTGKTLVNFVVYDKTNSIEVVAMEGKRFTKDFLETLKLDLYVSIRGLVEISTFTNQLQVRPFQITIVDSPSPVTDDYEGDKRVELHLHTKMSAMDGVTTITDYIKRASEFKMNAIGITDHGVVQAFPEMQKACDKYKIKPLYGVELYMIDDRLEYIFNPSPRKLKGETYVVLDLETTGLSARYDKIIEFGAVKFSHGVEIDHMDIFVNPNMKLSELTINLTGITDEMVKGGYDIKDALCLIKKFIGDAILVTHNASFDYGFLKEAFKNNNLGDLNNPVIDTLALAHYMLKDNSRFTLGAVCRALGVEYDTESAHRADYDAKVLNDSWLAMLSILLNKNPNLTHEQMNNLYDEDLYKHLRAKHVTVYAKNAQGLKDLFEIVSLSHTTYLAGDPKTPRSLLEKKRENLLIGSACSNGEIFETARNSSVEVLEKRMQFYDFIEIQPPACYSYLINKGELSNNDHLFRIIKDIIRSAEHINKPIVVTGDVHYLSKDEKMFRDVYIFAKALKNSMHPLNPPQRAKQKPYENPDQQFLSTTEMLHAFDFLNDEALVKKIVIDNSIEIASQIEYIRPCKDKLYTPTIDNCDKLLVEMVYKKAHEWYGETLPQIVEDRLKAELKGITDNNYFVIYYIASQIVTRTRDQGYLVGSRGSVGSSFIATMSSITEVNPLPPHYRCPKCKHIEWMDELLYKSGYDLPDKKCPVCGEQLIKDGQNLPFATFLGFNAEKVPDIDLNFPSDFQSRAHDMTKDLLGADNVYRAGTISTVAEKSAYGFALGYFEHFDIPADSIRKCELRRIARGCQDVKKTTGAHPGGIIVVPRGMSVYDFTAVQYPANDPSSPWKTTHFDFHAIHDNILKLDLLAHVDPMALRMMALLSKIDVYTLPLNDQKVLDLFSSPASLGMKENFFKEENGAMGLPEFGTNFVRKMLNETKPKTFADLVIISGLSHGTNVWNGNAEDLVNSKICTLREVIGCRDDIMLGLHEKYGIESAITFRIMEAVRKGKGLSEDFEKLMREHNVPDYYIDSCKKIQYLFPRAHAVAYVMMAIRVGWFKVYRPLEYYATFFTLRADKHDVKSMVTGIDAVKKKLIDFKSRREKNMPLDDKEQEVEKNLYVAYEMLDRGYKILTVDLYKSAATDFVVDHERNAIIVPFCALDNLGEQAGQSVVEERKNGCFTSINDLSKRTKLSTQNIETLKELKSLDELPLDDQMTLF